MARRSATGQGGGHGRGIHTFNRFDPHSPLFRELGDPDTLHSLPRLYELALGSFGALRTWVWDDAAYVVSDN